MCIHSQRTCSFYAPAFRSMALLEKHLTLVYAALAVPDEPAPPKGFIVTCLDIIASLCSALDSNFEAFLAADNARLIPMAVAACKVA